MFVFLKNLFKKKQPEGQTNKSFDWPLTPTPIKPTHLPIYTTSQEVKSFSVDPGMFSSNKEAKLMKDLKGEFFIQSDIDPINWIERAAQNQTDLIDTFGDFMHWKDIYKNSYSITKEKESIARNFIIWNQILKNSEIYWLSEEEKKWVQAMVDKANDQLKKNKITDSELNTVSINWLSDAKQYGGFFWNANSVSAWGKIIKKDEYWILDAIFNKTWQLNSKSFLDEEWNFNPTAFSYFIFYEDPRKWYSASYDNHIPKNKKEFDYIANEVKKWKIIRPKNEINYSKSYEENQQAIQNHTVKAMEAYYAIAMLLRDNPDSFLTKQEKKDYEDLVKNYFKKDIEIIKKRFKRNSNFMTAVETMDWKVVYTENDSDIDLNSKIEAYKTKLTSIASKKILEQKLTQEQQDLYREVIDKGRDIWKYETEYLKIYYSSTKEFQDDPLQKKLAKIATENLLWHEVFARTYALNPNLTPNQVLEETTNTLWYNFLSLRRATDWEHEDLARAFALGTEESGNAFALINAAIQTWRESNVLKKLWYWIGTGIRYVSNAWDNVVAYKRQLSDFIFRKEVKDLMLYENSTLLNVWKKEKDLEYFINYTSSAVSDVVANIAAFALTSPAAVWSSAVLRWASLSIQASKTVPFMYRFFGGNLFNITKWLSVYTTNAQKAAFLAKNITSLVLEESIQSFAADAFSNNFKRSLTDNIIDFWTGITLSRRAKFREMKSAMRGIVSDNLWRYAKDVVSSMGKEILDSKFFKHITDAERNGLWYEMLHILEDKMKKVNLEDPDVRSILQQEKKVFELMKDNLINKEEFIKRKFLENPEKNHFVKLSKNWEILWNRPIKESAENFSKRIDDAFVKLSKRKDSFIDNTVTKLRSVITDDFIKRTNEYARIFNKSNNDSRKFRIDENWNRKRIPQKELIKKAKEEYFYKSLNSIWLWEIKKEFSIATKWKSYSIRYEPIVFPFVQKVKDFYALWKSKKYLKAHQDWLKLIQRVLNSDENIAPFIHYVKINYPEYLKNWSVSFDKMSYKELEKLLKSYSEIGVNRRLQEFLMQTARESGIIFDESQLFFTKLSYEDLIKDSPERFTGMTYELWSWIMDNDSLSIFEKEALIRSYNPSSNRFWNRFFIDRSTGGADFWSSNAEVIAQLWDVGVVSIHFSKERVGFLEQTSSLHLWDVWVNHSLYNDIVNLAYSMTRKDDGTIVYNFHSTEDWLSEIEHKIYIKNGKVIHSDFNRIDEFKYVYFDYKSTTSTKILSEDMEWISFKDDFNVNLKNTQEHPTPNQSQPQPQTQTQTQTLWVSVTDLVKLSSAMQKGEVTNKMLSDIFGKDINYTEELLRQINWLKDTFIPKDQQLWFVLDIVNNMTISEGVDSVIKFTFVDWIKSKYIDLLIDHFIKDWKYISINNKIYFVSPSREGFDLFVDASKKEFVGSLDVTSDGNWFKTLSVNSTLDSWLVKSISLSQADDVIKQSTELSSQILNSSLRSNKKIKIKLSKDLKSDYFKIFWKSAPEHFDDNTLKEIIQTEVNDLINQNEYLKYFVDKDISVDWFLFAKNKVNMLTSYFAKNSEDTKKYLEQIVAFINEFFDPKRNKKMIKDLESNLQILWIKYPSYYDLIDAYLYRKFWRSPQWANFKKVKRQQRILSKLLGTNVVYKLNKKELNNLFSILPKLKTEESILKYAQENADDFIDFLQTSYRMIEDNNKILSTIDEVKNQIEEVVNTSKKRLENMKKEDQAHPQKIEWIKYDEDLINSRNMQIDVAIESVLERYRSLLESDPDNYIEYSKAINELEWLQKLRRNINNYFEDLALVKEFDPEAVLNGISMVNYWYHKKTIEDFVMNSPLFKNAVSETQLVNWKRIQTFSFTKTDRRSLVSLLEKLNVDKYNGMYIRDLHTIALNNWSDDFDIRSIGHEYYHFVVQTTEDVERIREINTAVYSKYKKYIDNSAEARGYTFEVFMQTVWKRYEDLDLNKQKEIFEKWKTEEWMADRFWEYVIGKYEPEDKTLADYFKDLLEKIKKIFTYQPALDLFDDIYQGKVLWNTSSKGNGVLFSMPEIPKDLWTASSKLEYLKNNRSNLDQLFSMYVVGKDHPYTNNLNKALSKFWDEWIKNAFSILHSNMFTSIIYKDLPDRIINRIRSKTFMDGNSLREDPIHIELSSLLNVSLYFDLIKKESDNIDYELLIKAGDDFYPLTHWKLKQDDYEKGINVLFWSNSSKSLWSKSMLSYYNSVLEVVNKKQWEKVIKNAISKDFELFDLGLRKSYNIPNNEFDILNDIVKLYLYNRNIIPHYSRKHNIEKLFYKKKDEIIFDIIDRIKRLDNKDRVSYDFYNNDWIKSVVFEMNLWWEKVSIWVHAPSPIFNDFPITEKPLPKLYQWDNGFFWETDNVSFSTKLVWGTDKVVLVKNITPQWLLRWIKNNSFSPSSMAIKLPENVYQTAYWDILLRMVPSKRTMEDALWFYGNWSTPSLTDLGVQSILHDKSKKEILDIYWNLIFEKHWFDLEEINDIIRSWRWIAAFMSKLLKKYPHEEERYIRTSLLAQYKDYANKLESFKALTLWSLYSKMREFLPRKEWQLKWKDFPEYIKDSEIKALWWIQWDVDVLHDEILNIDALLSDKRLYPKDVVKALEVGPERNLDWRVFGADPVSNLITIPQLTSDYFSYYKWNDKQFVKKINDKDILFIKNAVGEDTFNSVLKRFQIPEDDIVRTMNVRLEQNPYFLSNFKVAEDWLSKAIRNYYMNYTNYKAYFELFVPKHPFSDVGEIYISTPKLKELVADIDEIKSWDPDEMRQALQSYIKEKTWHDVEVKWLYDIRDMEVWISVRDSLDDISETLAGVSYNRKTKDSKSQYNYLMKFVSQDNTDKVAQFADPYAVKAFDSFSEETMYWRQFGVNPKTNTHSLKQLVEDIWDLYWNNTSAYQVKERDLILYKLLKWEDALLRLQKKAMSDILYKEIESAARTIELTDSIENEIKASKKKRRSVRRINENEFLLETIRESDEIETELFLELINKDFDLKRQILTLRKNIPELVSRLYYKAKRSMVGTKFELEKPKINYELLGKIASEQNVILNKHWWKAKFIVDWKETIGKYSDEEYKELSKKFWYDINEYKENAVIRNIIEERQSNIEKEAYRKKYAASSQKELFTDKMSRWYFEEISSGDRFLTYEILLKEKRMRALNNRSKVVKKLEEKNLENLISQWEEHLQKIKDLSQKYELSPIIQTSLVKIDNALTKNKKILAFLSKRINASNPEIKKLSIDLDKFTPLKQEYIYPPLVKIKEKFISKHIPLEQFYWWSGLSQLHDVRYKYKPAFVKELKAIEATWNQDKFYVVAPGALSENNKAILNKLDYVAIRWRNDWIYKEMKEYLSKTHELIFERSKWNVAYYQRKSVELDLNWEKVEMMLPNQYKYKDIDLPGEKDMIEVGEKIGEYLDFIWGKNCSING